MWTWLGPAGDCVGLVGGIVGLAAGGRALWKEQRAKSWAQAAKIRLTREWDVGPVLALRVFYDGREAHTDYLARLRVKGPGPGDLTVASFRQHQPHGRWSPAPSGNPKSRRTASALIRDGSPEGGAAVFVITGLFEAEAKRIRIVVEIQDDGRTGTVARRVFDMGLPEH